MLSDEELAACIDGEDAIKFFGGDFGNVAEGFDAGVGDYDVDVLEVRVGGVEELDDVGGLGNICWGCDGFAADSFDGFDDLREISVNVASWKLTKIRILQLWEHCNPSSEVQKLWGIKCIILTSGTTVGMELVSGNLEI